MSPSPLPYVVNKYYSHVVTLSRCEETEIEEHEEQNERRMTEELKSVRFFVLFNFSSASSGCRLTVKLICRSWRSDLGARRQMVENRWSRWCRCSRSARCFRSSQEDHLSGKQPKQHKLGSLLISCCFPLLC